MVEETKVPVARCPSCGKETDITGKYCAWCGENIQRLVDCQVCTLPFKIPGLDVKCPSCRQETIENLAFDEIPYMFTGKGLPGLIQAVKDNENDRALMIIYRAIDRNASHPSIRRRIKMILGV